MTTCLLVLGVVTCTLAPGTRLTPAEAAAILAPHQFVAPVATPPQIVLIPSSPTAGPFGEFAPFSIGRRLDGSQWTEPPWQTMAYPARHLGVHQRGTTGSIRLAGQPHERSARPAGGGQPR